MKQGKTPSRYQNVRKLFNLVRFTDALNIKKSTVEGLCRIIPVKIVKILQDYGPKR